MNHEITVHISAGKVTNSVPVAVFIRDLQDGTYNVRFQPRKIRTLNQNSYYHAQVVPLVREALVYAGYDEIKSNDDAHEVIKSLFLKKEITSKLTGEIITTIPGSTTDLTTTEFTDFLERVGKWAAEFLGLFIPPPGMQLKIHE